VVSASPRFHRPPAVDLDLDAVRGHRTQATVEGVSIAGVGHQLPLSGQLGYAISFLGLDSSA
jgi:hypothetical protein